MALGEPPDMMLVDTAPRQATEVGLTRERHLAKVYRAPLMDRNGNIGLTMDIPRYSNLPRYSMPLFALFRAKSVKAN